MDLILDHQKVEKAGGLKWEENKKFRDWLRSQPVEKVAAIVDQIGRKASSQFDCTTCAKCCRSLTITPKPTDIKRLSDGLGMDPYEFKTKYLKRDHEGDLVMKQRPCPFLKSGKCSVYEHRPETCRSYPHLERQHMTGRGWYIVENTLVCPIVYNTYEMLKAHFSNNRMRDISL